MSSLIPHDYRYKISSPTPVDKEPLILAGISGALSWLFLNIALKTGKTWQVAPIDKLSVVMTVIVSILIFQEEITLKGIIGVILIAAGSLFVALA